MSNINVWKDFSQIITLEKSFSKDGRNLTPDDLSIIENGAVVFNDNEILWVGKTNEIPECYLGENSNSFPEKILLPELVDSHTHLIFGGDRAVEYGMRLNGSTYEEIAAAGGGILNTTIGTNSSSSKSLLTTSIDKIKQIQSYGIGTIEIKSGYGLNYKKEKELTEIIHELKQYFYPKVQIKNTFMAAHAIPKEYDSSSLYLQKVVIPLLKEMAPLNIIDAVDIFHEVNYFTKEDVIVLFQEAEKLNIPTKIHADEFHDNGGATLAASFNSLSADHLLSCGEDGIKNISNSKTVATLLPGTGLFLGKKSADARKLLDSGAKVAIASDYNPGSCHCDNLLLLASIAAPMYKMNLAELWVAITLNAAHALGLYQQGVIKEKFHPRFSIFSCSKVEDITYGWGKNLFFANIKH
jgi:imidazolonepropionase